MKSLVKVVVSTLIVLLGFMQLGLAEETGSVYEVPMKWVDQTGKDFNLSDLKGKNVVVTMAYTRCKTACPLTFKRLKGISEALAEQDKKAEFVVVTFDEKHDSPEAMEMFMKHNNLTGENWHLLTGKSEDIRTLSVLLGISYQLDTKTNEYTHSNKILLLDEKGAIKVAVEGLASSTEEIVNGINQ